MKVLTIGRLPLNEVGGLPLYTVNLAAALQELGVEQLVVHPGPDVPAVAYPFATRAPQAVTWPLRGRLRSFRQAFAAAREAVRTAAEFEPDLIHLQYGGAMDLALLRRLSKLDVPVVVTAHCGRAWAHLARKAHWFVPTLNRAARVLAISQDQCALFVGAGLERERLAQIGSLIEAEFFAPLAPAPAHTMRPRAVYLGRIAPEKGLDLVLDALAELHPDERPQFQATGPVAEAYALELYGRADHLGVRAWFELLPPVATPLERREVLDGADFLLHPTRSDVKPLVVIEAMARALPVLASDLPGTVELMAGVGHHFAVGNAHDLARALRSVMHTSLARDEAARALAETYRPHNAARETLEHFRDILGLPSASETGKVTGRNEVDRTTERQAS